MAYSEYRFRFYPNATQERELLSQLETLRQVHNNGLAWWKDAYEAEKSGEEVIPRRPSPTGTGVRKMNLLETVTPIFSTLRNLQIADRKAGGAGPHWLTRVSFTAVRDTIKRLHRSFLLFFKKCKQGASKPGFPKFKSYGRVRSLPFDNYAQGCTIRAANGRAVHGNIAADSGPFKLDVFGVGKMQVVVHRDIVGEIKTAVVKWDIDGKWYVGLVCEQDAPTPVPKEGSAIGIDMGLENFFTDSNGLQRPNPRHLKTHLKELRRLQQSTARKVSAARKANRKQRECKNLLRSRHKVACLHVRIRNLRKEHHHQEANRLVRENGTICVEKLDVQGMVKRNKLARSIMDAGWSAFLNVLRRKASRTGVRFVEVDPCGTSQICPECGETVRKPLWERKHNCPNCGYTAHRDHAAARNILNRGVLGGAVPVPVGHNPGNSPDVQQISRPAQRKVRGKKAQPLKKAPPATFRQLTLWDIGAELLA